jgi:zinc D-Ala-D-Ala carboxypeptidase
MKKIILLPMLSFMFLPGCQSLSLGISDKPAAVSAAGSSSPNQQGQAPTKRIAADRFTNPTSILVLVNKEHPLPGGYVPPDLITPNVPFPFKEDLPKKKMRKEAAAALEDLFVQASKDGLHLYAMSGYRSYETQKQIFNHNLLIQGQAAANAVSAHPGTSEHQTGLAMDLTTGSMHEQLEQSFASTPEGIWVQKHAAEFGFIVRYPKGKEKITGYEYEPWHIRYVGKEVAQEIKSKNITFDEYVNALDH